LNQPLLMDSYPRAPDGSAQIEREQMTADDVKFNRWGLTQEAMESYGKADALHRWWRQKRRAKRALTPGNAS
jgi:hypothetical protein